MLKITLTHEQLCSYTFAYSTELRYTPLLILHKIIKKSKKIQFKFFENKSKRIYQNQKEFIMRKIFVPEISVWRQMKENYQIYFPYQFHWRPQPLD